MLKSLKIKNLAVIDYAELHLDRGLCVLTGETGAGKSLVVGAIELLIGARADSTRVRTGSDEAIVEGVFEHSGRTNIVRRRISSTGRSYAWFDGMSVSISDLTEKTAGFADLLGQHEHQTILDQRTHIELLDRFCGITSLSDEFSTEFHELEQIESLLRKTREGIERERERIRLREFELQELSQAQLDPEEFEEIEAKIARIDAAERIFERATKASEHLNDGAPDALQLVAAAEKSLLDIADLVPEVRYATELVETAQAALAEAARVVSDIADSVDVDAEEAEILRDRQNLIERLRRKYNRDVRGLIDYQKELEGGVTNLQGMESKMESISKDIESRLAILVEKANTLRKKREAGAIHLQHEITGALYPLGMENVEFEIKFMRTEDPNGPITIDNERFAMLNSGSESAEFYISPNPGEALKPLAAIVSGGELSRIMLAIKSIIGSDYFEGITVFDEIDSGIGGKVANAVGKELLNLAGKRQLLVITHLPQIARMADVHLRITKFEEKGRTRVNLERLSLAEKVEEIERMHGGRIEMAAIL